jgi:hypothetical protein
MRRKRFRIFEFIVGLLVIAACCIPVRQTILLFDMVPAGAGRIFIISILAIICLKLITGQPKDYYRFFMLIGYKVFGYRPAKSNRAYRRR